jgi:hypothetical protein
MINACEMQSSTTKSTKSQTAHLQQYSHVNTPAPRATPRSRSKGHPRLTTGPAPSYFSLSHLFFKSALNPSKPSLVDFQKPVPSAIRKDKMPEKFSACTNVVPPGVLLLGSKRNWCSPVNRPGMPHSMPRQRNSCGELVTTVGEMVMPCSTLWSLVPGATVGSAGVMDFMKPLVQVE